MLLSGESSCKQHRHLLGCASAPLVRGAPNPQSMKRLPTTAQIALVSIVSLTIAPLTQSSAQTAAPAPATEAAPHAPVKPAKPAPKPRTPEDAVTPAIKNPERHAKFLERIKQGEVGLLFLGDSITDAWPRAGAQSWAKFEAYKPADFGISGDRTEHLLWRITNGELEGIAPKATVLMIGTNNIGHFSDEKPEWAAAGVKKIVETIREKLPQTRILLLGVFPRGTADSAQRKAVEEINKLIAPLADGKTVTYLDVSKSFLDEKGELPKDIMPDKLHPNAKGYDIWYEAMWPTLEKLLK